MLTRCGGSKKATEADKKPVVKAASINQIHFFLETSASMGGYLKGGTAFKDVVSEIVTKANTIKPVTVYTISEAPKTFAGDLTAFVTGLATTPLATGRSSELHKVFRQVGEKAKGNDIAILVSDCILSFPDAEIRKNPDINQTDASSVLKSEIYNQFSQLNKAGIGATVYAYNSPFNGTYYDYQNRKQKLTGESRPFYVWVIGKQELLGQFNTQLQDLLTNKPAKQLNFGSGKALTAYELFFSLNKKGDWRVERGNVTELAVKPAKPAEFAVGLTLNSLPTYAQTDEFLKKNIVITAPSATIKLITVQKKEAIKDISRLRERELKLLNSATHVLTFQVSNLYDDKADVTVKLPARSDDWYQTTWTTMDDRTADDRRNKTFALEHLMNGVKEAYQSSSNDFLQLQFSLFKK
ncbi:MAG: hypothetical protein H7Z72_18110 [Bacteroidetes bacterium]|nr:hypothetical protein [Fibrella sp.]